MTGRMMEWMDGKDDPHRTKPRLLYKKIVAYLRDFYRPLRNNNNNRSIYFYMRIFET
jgi:hypothetical protein